MRRVALAILLSCSYTQAQELPEVPEFKLKPIPPGEDRFVVINKGDRAEFSGQLFDPPTALRWANYLEQYRVQLRLCESSTVALRAADKAYYSASLESEQEKHQLIRQDLLERLRKVEDSNATLQEKLNQGPPWYNTFGFGLTLGVAGATMLTISGVFLAGAVN